MLYVTYRSNYFSYY